MAKAIGRTVKFIPAMIAVLVIALSSVASVSGATRPSSVRPLFCESAQCGGGCSNTAYTPYISGSYLYAKGIVDCAPVQYYNIKVCLEFFRLDFAVWVGIHCQDSGPPGTYTANGYTAYTPYQHCPSYGHQKYRTTLYVDYQGAGSLVTVFGPSVILTC